MLFGKFIIDCCDGEFDKIYIVNFQLTRIARLTTTVY